MATAIFVITSAMQDIGATSTINPASPEAVNTSLNRLLQMLNQWLLKVDLGDSFVLPTETTDEMNNDADTDLAIIQNLSIVIAPTLRKPITLDQRVNARDSYSDLLVNHAIRPEQPYPSTLPRGAGRRHVPFSRQYYTEPERKDTETVQPDSQ